MRRLDGRPPLAGAEARLSQRLPFRRHERARRPIPTICRFQPPGSVCLCPAPFHHGVDFCGRQLRHPPTRCRTLRPCRQEGKRTGQVATDGRARYRGGPEAAPPPLIEPAAGAPPKTRPGAKHPAHHADHGHSPSEFQQTSKRLSRTGVPGPRDVPSICEDPAGRAALAVDPNRAA